MILTRGRARRLQVPTDKTKQGDPDDGCVSG